MKEREREKQRKNISSFAAFFPCFLQREGGLPAPQLGGGSQTLDHVRATHLAFQLPLEGAMLMGPGHGYSVQGAGCCRLTWKWILQPTEPNASGQAAVAMMLAPKQEGPPGPGSWVTARGEGQAGLTFPEAT